MGAIAENFSEPDEIKPVYVEYYSKLLSLPSRRCKGVIELSSRPTIQPEGMNAAPDWLIDKNVKTSETDSAYVSAVLLTGLRCSHSSHPKNMMMTSIIILISLSLTIARLSVNI